MKIYLKRKGGQILEYAPVLRDVSVLRIRSEDLSMAKVFHFDPRLVVSVKRNLWGVYFYSLQRRSTDIFIKLDPPINGPYAPQTVDIASHKVVIHVGRPSDNPEYRRHLEHQMKIRLVHEIRGKLRASGHTFEVPLNEIKTHFEECISQEFGGGVRFTITSEARTYLVPIHISRADAALRDRYQQ